MRRSLGADQSELLVREPVVHTEPGLYPVYAIGIHEVSEGETLEMIAGELGLDQRTVFWANHDLLSSAEALAGGQQLRVLPLDGAYHVVAADETIESIAAAYGVPPRDIADYKGNAIPESGVLRAGQALVIPGAALPEIPIPTPVVETSSFGLIWPVGGFIS